MKMKNKISKKAQMNTWGILTKAIIVLIVAGILLFYFRGSFHKEGKIVDDTFCGANGDYDHDGIVDVIDSCLCSDEKQCETLEGRKSCKAKRDEECKKAQT